MRPRLLWLAAALAACGCVETGRPGEASRPPRAVAATTRPAGELKILSGGNVAGVLREAVAGFRSRTGAAVRYESGSSGATLAAVMAGRDADLYVAADLRHIRAAERENVVAAKVPVAALRLAILVAKGNPKGIRGLKDLQRKGLRVYTESPQGCQVGTATADLLAANGVRIAGPPAAEGKRPSLRSAPRLIRAGLLDAAIVWDSTAGRLAGQVDVVGIPPARNVSVNIVAIRLRSSPNPALAEQFMGFLRSPMVRAVWARHGFRTPPVAGASATGPTSREARSAQRMIRASESTLAPVYAPLAEHLVKELRLAGRTGVGIDLGSGPGTLIVELCRRTKLHWINADINPCFFGYFLKLAGQHGVADRVSAVLADAQAMPFRDGYADVVVSRGCYHFWPDRKKGFAEVYRVLKPGGVAYVGRGFSANLPVETARRIRARQGRPMRYDRQKEADALGRLMAELGIRQFRVHLPKPRGGEDVHYGLWVEFHKPPAAAK